MYHMASQLATGSCLVIRINGGSVWLHKKHLAWRYHLISTNVLWLGSYHSNVHSHSMNICKIVIVSGCCKMYLYYLISETHLILIQQCVRIRMCDEYSLLLCSMFTLRKPNWKKTFVCFTFKIPYIYFSCQCVTNLPFATTQFPKAWQILIC